MEGEGERWEQSGILHTVFNGSNGGVSWAIHGQASPTGPDKRLYEAFTVINVAVAWPRSNRISAARLQNFDVGMRVARKAKCEPREMIIGQH